MTLNRINLTPPFFLSHLVTARCNCQCPACLWRNNFSPEMDTEETIKLYNEAGRYGFAANVIWGGEPLLRKDLPEICRASRQAGMITIVITNGYYLPKRYEEIAPELDALIVSLDHAHADKHDASRQCKGLFDNTVQGIKLTRKKYPDMKILLNCLLYQKNVNEIADVVRLAQSLNVSLYVSPALEGIPENTSESNRASLAKEEEIKKNARLLLELKNKGFPVNNSKKYLQGYLLENQSYKCRIPVIFINIKADGTVLNCFTHGPSPGNARNVEFKKIVDTLKHPMLLAMGNNCQKCIVPDVVETSYVWSLSPEPLFNTLKVFWKR